MVVIAYVDLCCTEDPNVGALIIRIVWGPLYYICNKEPPKYC